MGNANRSLTIRRDLWARGIRQDDGTIYRNWFPNGFGQGLNRMLNANGRRSALGFMCEQLGNVPEEKLREHGYPFSVGIGLKLKSEGTNPDIPASYPDVVEIARINDRTIGYEKFTNADQERLIAEKLVAAFGAELGFDKVEFVD